jgi:tetratricopeptide (TPR) repeat protein
VFDSQSLPDLRTVASIAQSSLVVGFVAGMAIAIWREIRQDVVFIENIEVPADLARRGYSSAVVAARVLDEARAIQRSATSAGSRRALGNVAALADLQLPGGRISVRALVRFARALLGRPAVSIGGEITADDDGFRIRLRVLGMAVEPVGKVHAAVANVDEVLRQGALQLLQAVDPLTVTLHFGDTSSEEGEARARGVLQNVIRDGNALDRARAFGELGRIEGAKGNSDAAARFYAESIAAHHRITAPVHLGNFVTILMQAGRGEEAEAIVRKVEARRPRDADNFTAAAYAWNVLGFFDAAVAAADAALAINLRHPLAHQYRGMALIRVRRFTEAVEALQRANELDPDQRLAEAMHVVALVRANRAQDALALARRIVERAPDSHNANLGLGFAKLACGDVAGSIATFELAERQFPHDEWCKVEFGNALMAEGRPADALVRYEEAILENPRFSYAWYGAGDALSKLGENEQAITKFEQAARLDPQDSQTLCRWADALDALGRSDEAAAKRDEANTSASLIPQDRRKGRMRWPVGTRVRS